MWTAVAATGYVADVETAAVDPPVIEAQQVGQFSPYVFAFHTTIHDDGRDERAGIRKTPQGSSFPESGPDGQIFANTHRGLGARVSA